MSAAVAESTGLAVSVSRDDLLAALAPCAEIASRGSVMMMLQSVKIVGTGEGLTLHACDGAVHVSSKVQCSPSMLGELCVSAKDLKSTVDGMPSGDVRLSADGKTLLVQSGLIKAKLNLTSDPKDFPEHRPATGGDIPFDDFRDAFKRLGWAIAEDGGGKNALKGLILWPRGEQTEISASNTHVLLTLHSKTIIPLPVLLSARLCAASVAGMVLSLDEKSRTVSAASDAVTISTGIGGEPLDADLFRSRLTHDLSATIDAGAFSSAISRAMPIAITNLGRRSRVTISEGAMVVRARSDQAGEFEEEVAVSGSDEIKFAVNLSYLAGLLKTLDCETVRMTTEDSRHITLTDVLDSGRVATAMPLSWDGGR